MFFTSEHKMTNEEQFFIKSQHMGRNLPSNLQLHLSLIYVDNQTFQCVWEAESLEMVEDYVEAQLADCCQSHYFEVDPFSAIGA
ncbi:hypothetical protein UB33_11395 [Photobacterium angustum]|uniref:hypothetical protein n=1 Tax=Photobacterium angustum TaxID=661 RepID=UPI0005DAB29A|nr:hypothetical protein [Photobacterium angustum]KJF94026.1 hypothetical protein UB39_12470 [Photobacterium angustum]KJG05961.1 hypothetical protein UB33_11395 [Photobacterium angustum]PSV92545.1 hypothetical protein CTN01_12010 [Photobacterium angustum]PSW82578.1 hypothetical protein CTN03_05245 [Photobacterium angustum]